MIIAALGGILLTLTAALAQLVFRRTAAWLGAICGSAALAAGMALIVIATAAGSSALFTAGSVVAGAGFGVAFLGGLRQLAGVIPGERRAAVMSAFYLVGYASLSVPAVLAGLVVTHLGLETTSEISRLRRRQRRAGHGGRGLADAPPVAARPRRGQEPRRRGRGRPLGPGAGDHLCWCCQPAATRRRRRSMDSEDELLGTSPGDHLVLFYRTEEELTERAGEHLHRALAAGGAAIAIATPAHRLMLEEWLAGAGTDVAAARARGRYLDRDAGETVRRFEAAGLARCGRILAGDQPAYPAGEPERAAGSRLRRDGLGAVGLRPGERRHRGRGDVERAGRAVPVHADVRPSRPVGQR